MLISTRGRYALRVMIDLAEREGEGRVPLGEIAGRQGISEKYLESIIASLSRADYVTGLRGKGGGYQLTRPAGEYTLFSILRLTEGSLAPVACLDGAAGCEKAAGCRTLPLWKGLDRAVEEYLSRYTLEDLTRGRIPE